jgi:hypothetical protein
LALAFTPSSLYIPLSLSFVCQSLQKRLLSRVQREKEFFGRWFVAPSTFKSTGGPRYMMMVFIIHFHNAV